MSFDSIAGSSVSVVTSTTSPEPSASDFAVCTALPSFQNSSTQATMSNNRPNNTPLIEARMRENHEVVVVSVKESVESDEVNEPLESVSVIAIAPSQRIIAYDGQS